MKHECKKIESGYYEYRGHNIGRCGLGLTYWSIAEVGEEYSEDYRNTLKFAKDYIDQKIAYQERRA